MTDNKKVVDKNEKTGKPEKPEPLESVSFFKIFRYATTTDILYIIVGTIMATASGSAQPLFALFFGEIPDSLGPAASLDGLVRASADLALKFVYVAIGSLVTSYIGFACWRIVGERQSNEIRKRYFKSLLQQDIAFYDSINPNELSTKIAEECFNIQQGVGEKVSTYLYSMSLLITGLVIGLVKGWQLALVLTGFLPVIAISGSIFVFAQQKLTSINNEAYARAGAISEEVLNAVRTVASLGGQKKETKRYDKVLNGSTSDIRKYAMINGAALGIIMFAIFAVYALGFYVGSIFIKNEIYNPGNSRDYTVGDVLIVFFAIQMASIAPARAAPSVKAFSIAKINAAKAFKIIDRESKISIADPRGLKPQSVEGNIQFRNVKFAYPLKQERVILNGINFDIRKNEKTAFVGESGCGKTTCMQLIERFYDIENGNGSIKLDGNELKELNLKWMRENIGYVGQEPVLFATSIKENLLMAKDDATEAELWDALTKANSADFVRSLPDKLDTFVGSNGTMLSGGQKQRLAIARAILKNPKILLLDEATSALDRKNEMEIQKTLDSISEGRTTIVIAHRLSTIINADHIIVFDQGVVVEEGRHEELVAKKGKYYALQHLQLQAEDKSKEENPSGSSNDETQQVKARKESTNQASNNNNGESLEAIKVIENIKDKPKNTANTLQLFKRLLSYNKQDYPIIFTGIIGGALYGAVQPFLAPILANILNVLAVPSASDYNSRSGLFSGLFLVAAVVAGIGLGVQDACFNVLAEKMSRKVRLQVFEKYVRMPIGWFDDPLHSAGALGAKLSTDATLINTVIRAVFGPYIQAASSLITGVIIAFVADWKIALVGLGITPLLVASGLIQAQFDQQLTAANEDAYQESIAFASEAVNNMRTVVSFGKEDKLLENYSKKLEVPLNNAIKNSHKAGLSFGTGQAILFASLALIFYVGALFMRDYALSFKDMYMGIIAILFGAMGTGQAMQYAGDLGAGKNAAINIFHILDTKPAIDIDDPKQTVKKPIKGDIEFKNVWFKYPSREKQIFSGLNLKINASNKTALVGPSGCGKSTILALVQRFYDVDQGEILIDGINIKEYDLKHLRESFGVVSQEPVLFNGTIEYNIKYSKEDATDEEMRAAATKACAIGFIEANQFDVAGDEKDAAAKFGTGFQRKVGPKGGQMSGGQKQRIAIARAILKNPSLLILDEATSALDAQNEKTVQEALDKIMEGKTSLIVAHRISTIKDADEIVVFSEGKIAERGSYKELTEMRGMFYKLERGMNTTV